MPYATQSSSIIMLDQSPAGFGEKADELDAELFESDLPTQHSHPFFEDDALGLYIGLWDTDDMIEAPGPYSCDEFMLLLEGEVRVKDNLTAEFTTVSEGDAFVLPKGYDCQWHQQGYLRKFYVISEHPDEDIPKPAALEETIIIPLNTAGKVIEESVLFPELNAGNSTEVLSYSDTRNRFLAGVWQSTAFDTQTISCNQYCLLSVRVGAIHLWAAGEQQQIVSAGQTCFIPSNTELQFGVSEDAIIQFCVVRP